MRRIVFYLLLYPLLLGGAWGNETYGVWFAPDGGSPDLVDLFRQPQLWSQARSHIDVFKFGPVRLTPHANTKRNSFEELRDVDAFGKLHGWGIKIASEEGAVKPWDCTGQQAAKVTEGHIRGVHEAGGSIDLIAMDEPFTAGRKPCGLALPEIARRTADYVRAVISSDEAKVAGAVPLIGDIEPYPSFSVNELKQWADALAANGYKPAFVHIDVNVHFVDVHPEVNFKDDLRALQGFFRQRGIPFGVILWSGYDPLNSDRVYYEHVMKLVHQVKDAVGRPDQIIFQSWVTRSTVRCQQSEHSCTVQQCSVDDPPYCGENSIPINLPESDAALFTHARLINDALKVLGTR